MKRTSIFWLPQATKDLALLPHQIQESVFKKVDLLEDFPLMGPAMFGAFQGYRSLLMSPYLIIYKTKLGGRLEICRIIHGRRQRQLRLVSGEKNE